MAPCTANKNVPANMYNWSKSALNFFIELSNRQSCIINDMMNLIDSSFTINLDRKNQLHRKNEKNFIQKLKEFLAF